MAGTQWDVIVDALLTAFKADAAVSATGVMISDGLPISEDYAELLLMVAANSDGEDTHIGSGIYDSHDTGTGANATRDDKSIIKCSIRAATGDVEPAPVRAAAFGLLRAMDACLRAYPSLGIVSVIRTEITNVSVLCEQSQNGTAVWLLIEITATSLI